MYHFSPAFCSLSSAALVGKAQKTSFLSCQRPSHLKNIPHRHSVRTMTTATTEVNPFPETAVPTILPPPDTPTPTVLKTIVARDAAKAIKFYEKALGAKTESLFHHDDGKVMHSILVTSYDMRIAIEDHFPDLHIVKPVEEDLDRGGKALDGSYTYVTIPKGGGTADEAVEKMRAAGATVVRECEDAFYGHRMGIVVDVYGIPWTFGHEIEGFTPPWAQ